MHVIPFCLQRIKHDDKSLRYARKGIYHTGITGWGAFESSIVSYDTTLHCENRVIR